MPGYYATKLSAERLQLCYEIAPPRVKQYLEAEIDFVLSKMKPSDYVLELGCGYGRVLQRVIEKAETVVGIDTSYDSLILAREMFNGAPSCHLLVMDAGKLGFNDRVFDVVICIQNGLSAFKVNQRKLVEEAMRVLCSGGVVLFSSYSERFWEDRLNWFLLQSKYGLVGEIDEDATGNGVIVCNDGFRASTIGPDEFIALVSDLNIEPVITEVDNSSIFFEIQIE